MNRDINALDQELIADIERKDAAGSGRLWTRHIPHLIPRSDGASVFEEARCFSGLERSGQAEAGITLVASPHIPPSLPLPKLLASATEIFGRSPQISEGISRVKTVSPQVMVWWRQIAGPDDGRADILTLTERPADVRREFAEVIGRQTLAAQRILAGAVGQPPTIWACWGFATPVERLLTGLSRGAPTNKHGHLHVTRFSGRATDAVETAGLPLAERINQYAPWSSVFHRHAAAAITDLLTTAGTPDAYTVTPYSEAFASVDAPPRSSCGYRIRYHHPRPMSLVIGDLIAQAAALEQLHRSMRQTLRWFYTTPAPQSEVATLVYRAAPFGFTQSQAQNLVAFIKQLHPTYTELVAWRLEVPPLTSAWQAVRARLTDTIVAYEDRRNRPASKDGSRAALEAAILHDGLALPGDFDAVRSTWPVHASLFLTIDDYEVSGNDLLISSVNLVPNIATTASAVEYKTGAVLRRALPA